MIMLARQWQVDHLHNARSALASTGADHLYSVAALTTSGGQVHRRYTYDAYGKRLVLNPDGTPHAVGGIVSEDRYGFTGREWDAETGLWYFRARMYSDRLGRLVSRDPMGYVDGHGQYSSYFIPNGTDWNGMEFVDRGGSRVSNIQLTGGVYGETYASYNLKITCVCSSDGKWTMTIQSFRITVSSKTAVLANDPSNPGQAFLRLEHNIRRSEDHESQHRQYLKEIHDTVENYINREIGRWADRSKYSAAECLFNAKNIETDACEIYDEESERQAVHYPPYFPGYQPPAIETQGQTPSMPIEDWQ